MDQDRYIMQETPYMAVELIAQDGYTIEVPSRGLTQREIIEDLLPSLGVIYENELPTRFGLTKPAESDTIGGPIDSRPPVINR